MTLEAFASSPVSSVTARLLQLLPQQVPQPHNGTSNQGFHRSSPHGSYQ